jgi:hypothetical protein
MSIRGKVKHPRGPKAVSIADGPTAAILDDPLMEPTRGRDGGLRGGVIKTGPLKPQPRKRATKR